MTYVACCHSATYSFTSKPEKGGAGRLARSATANYYARQPAIMSRVVCTVRLYSGWQLQVSSATSPPYFRLIRKAVGALW